MTQPSFVMASSPAPSDVSFTAALSASLSRTSSAAPQTFTVQVGNGDHKFKPDVIQAYVGDVSPSLTPILRHTVQGKVDENERKKSINRVE